MRIPAILSIAFLVLALSSPARSEAPGPPPRPGLVYGWYDPATDRFFPESPAADADAARVDGTLVVRITVDLVTSIPDDKAITVFVNGQFGDVATYNDYRTFGTAKRDGDTATFEFKVPYGIDAAVASPAMTVWVDVSTQLASSSPRTSQTLRTPAPKSGGLIVVPVNLAL